MGRVELTLRVGFLLTIILTGIFPENTRYYFIGLARCYLDIKIYEMYFLMSIGNAVTAR